MTRDSRAQVEGEVAMHWIIIAACCAALSSLAAAAPKDDLLRSVVGLKNQVSTGLNQGDLARILGEIKSQREMGLISKGLNRNAEQAVSRLIATAGVVLNGWRDRFGVDCHGASPPRNRDIFILNESRAYLPGYAHKCKQAVEAYLSQLGYEPAEIEAVAGKDETYPKLLVQLGLSKISRRSEEAIAVLSKR